MPYVKVGKGFVHYVAPRPVDQARGHVVLMVHGAYDNHTLWRNVYASLKDAHTPVAIDLPGRGGSDGPPIATADGFRAFFGALVRAMKLPPFVFFGHSMGGSMAVDFASRQPKRVKAVIALSSSPDWNIPRAEIALWNRDPDRAFAENLGNLFAAKAPIALVETYDRQLRQTPPLSCRADIAACATFDTARRLEAIECPTLVVTGAEEAWIEGSRRLAEGIAGARLRVIPNAGHAIALEQAQKLSAAAERFLGRLR